jgi:asparagine synthase (glutamine-hydrolysing)
MFLKGGVRRPLARAALSDRLPPAVLDEKRKGLQAADWHVGLTADRDGVRALLDRIASDPLASDILDVKLLQRLVDDWPTDNWHDPVIVARYRNALLTALSAGHFLVSV